jgi:HAMP domain-containing protein
VFDDALLGPDQLTLVSSAPVRSLEGGPAEAFLVGVNSDLQVGAMMREMLSVWELRGFSIVERGSTFLALEPDVVLHMGTASILPTATRGVDHPVFRSVSQSPTGTLEYASLQGVPMLAAYEWLPDWHMGVVVELPQAEILSGLNQLAPFMAAVIIAAGLLTILAVAFTSNRAIRPLTRLVDFAERISHGDWRYRVPEDRDDEVGALASAFNRMAHDLSGMYQSLEDRVNERTRQVRTAAEVARAVISTPSLEDLLLRAVNLIRERFGFDHVSIFLLDEKGRYAVLRASTGEVGARLVARGHRLEVGSNSMIGWVSAHNAPRLASDVGQDPVHMKNELLPDTRAEAAVPLQVTGQVLGVLDVQSRVPDAFSADDLEILQTLADQLSAAILNARLAQRSAQAAERARIVSQITLDLSGQPDLNAVLQSTARALHHALGSPEVVIAVTQSPGEASPFFAPLPEEGGASPRSPRQP